MKTLLFHDTFLMKGGAERMNISIARGIDADIATAIWDKNCYDPRTMGYQGEIFEVNPYFKKGIIGFFIMKWKFFRSKNILKNYTNILFSNEAISGIWSVAPGTKTYYYAHSISRHLFDQKDDYIKKVPPIIRPLFSLFAYFLRELYKKEISKIDTIFVNSQANKRRMSEWLDRDDAIVLYPSVDLEKFNIFDRSTVSQKIAIERISYGIKEYYLSFSRLTHAKRIDSIIRVFQNNPEKNIVILYGKNDSQKDEFIKLGAGFSNIIFHELSDNNNLPYIINGSIATICISKNEDFGMVSIESMACGVPVFAADEGGYQETMIENKTGFLIDTNDLEKNLDKKLNTTDSSSLIAMQDDCRKRALDFSEDTMISSIQSYIR